MIRASVTHNTTHHDVPTVTQDSWAQPAMTSVCTGNLTLRIQSASARRHVGTVQDVILNVRSTGAAMRTATVCATISLVTVALIVKSQVGSRRTN